MVDADPPTLSITQAQDGLDRARADRSAPKLRRSAARDRPVTGDDGLNSVRPGPSEKAKAVWPGEGGRAAGDKPMPRFHPKPWDSGWTPRGAKDSWGGGDPCSRG